MTILDFEIKIELLFVQNKNISPIINDKSKNMVNQQNDNDNQLLPEEAIKNGFINKLDWETAKKCGFENYNDWINAKNEGFETKNEWDDWQEIKSSDLVDLASYYESKDIGFIQNKLRKSFIVSLKLAKKSGFDSLQSWKDAKKLDIDNFSEWLVVKDLQLQSIEEYQLIKEFQKKITRLIEEINEDQGQPLEKIITVISKDYYYNRSETKGNDLVYKNLTKERFEDLLERTIKITVLDSEIYRYSRLTNSILKITKLQLDPNLTPEKLKHFNNLLCPKCEYEISKTSVFCENCGQKIESCSICKLALEIGEIGTCPKCKTSFHLHHFLEVIKVYGSCPICKSEVREQDIMIRDE